MSDNGASYISADLAKWLDGQGMNTSAARPIIPMTQGKIERWHQTLKNRILLENYYLPGDLEAQIDAFVGNYNHRATTRASTTSPRPTSTSGGARPSSSNEKGSNDRPSQTAACSTGCRPHKSQTDEPEPPLLRTPIRSQIL